VIPRGGEVSRCYNLYKLDKTPVEISFGTVVVERIVDVICLLTLVCVSFLAEYEKLLQFIETLPIGAGNNSRLNTIFLILAALVLAGVFFLWLVKKNKNLNAFVRRTWLGFREGLLSVFRLKNKGLFIFYSVLIWVLYFLMSYCVIMAFPETRHLGITAVLSLFAIGSIAMAAPLPGGTGSYHVLVPQGLVFLYHIAMADAVAFTFIFHGWQTAIMIFGGAISLIITSIVVKKK
jgi:glycosyltransferase 2 family protein